MAEVVTAYRSIVRHIRRAINRLRRKLAEMGGAEGGPYGYDTLTHAYRLLQIATTPLFGYSAAASIDARGSFFVRRDSL
jgi:hypothetical protein